jgi:hypothetical protein
MEHDVRVVRGAPCSEQFYATLCHAKEIEQGVHARASREGLTERACRVVATVMCGRLGDRRPSLIVYRWNRCS